MSDIYKRKSTEYKLNLQFRTQLWNFISWFYLEIGFYICAHWVVRWFIFKPKNPNLGIFLRSLECKMLLYVMTIWNILRQFDKLVEFVCIWYIFPILVCMYQEKYGKPGERGYEF
jgi:hypothetical protein